ncbi:hypothetical protein C9374_002245 [Naegleria lovaniensis]|uniref:Borealin N-terminal domain-containing protein n=1 Tax=Naegleria lovaniensis TaxID=51637 RepID=A0AA88KMH3_NAELO|nr:uncharacterized protein C9374_002245 [Naegleria lovaniensis]KAG2386501.1 hypothetical protein C9374_002245 [Naegleria lovaniensis]
MPPRRRKACATTTRKRRVVRRKKVEADSDEDIQQAEPLEEVPPSTIEQPPLQQQQQPIITETCNSSKRPSIIASKKRSNSKLKIDDENFKSISFREQDVEIEIPRSEEYESAKESDAEKQCRTPLAQILRKRTFDSCEKENSLQSASKVKEMFMGEEQLTFLKVSYQQEVDNRVKMLRAFTNSQCTRLEMEMKMKIASLPQKIRQMTVAEFLQYHEDIGAFIGKIVHDDTLSLERRVNFLRMAHQPKTPRPPKHTSTMAAATNNANIMNPPSNTPQTKKLRMKSVNNMNTPTHHKQLNSYAMK